MTTDGGYIYARHYTGFVERVSCRKREIPPEK